MKESLHKKLRYLKQRYEEINHLLSDPAIVNDQAQFRNLSKELSQLEPVVECFNRYQVAEQQQQAATALLAESDPEMQLLAEEELTVVKLQLMELQQELQTRLLPHDPNDERNIFLEVRAGTGGDEAAIFAGELFRMYSRYAELKGWKVELLSVSQGEQGGYKEVISRIVGNGAYSQLKFESGAHRVQRVPQTESQGRIHTSACTVAVLPELEEVDHIEINPADLRVDTYRSSGAGGQHVNTTDSAIRITHIPTGIVVECQDERSQHKNRARAMSLLYSRILASQQNKQRAEQAVQRRNLVGSGDRSERIRTYNFPQGRVTDHRINLTLYKLDEMMEGYIEPIIDSLIREHQADLLAEMGDV